MTKLLLLFLVGALSAGLSGGEAGEAKEGTFAADLSVLKKYTDVVELVGNGGQARVAVVPQYQGRVMTSSATGLNGAGFGWLNYKLIASGERQDHINVFGGEDRFWFGPEGGQFSVFFPPGQPFDFTHWQTPAPIDWGGWRLVSRSADRARFRKRCSLLNWSNHRLEVSVDREVRLLNKRELEKAVGVGLDGLAAVGYVTDNKITNVGTEAWTKKTGALSIWILGMYRPSPQTTIVIPFKPGPEDKLGRIVNDAYFGKVPAQRLIIRKEQGVLFFRGDGKYRSKIGINAYRSRPVAGSYDAGAGVLTLVQFNLPEGVTDYVNSMWELQKKPFAGDVVNSYNDGPNETGSVLGPFYELETSSPAALLEPGASLQHLRWTIHLQGDRAALDRIARDKLGIGLDEIVAVFK